MKNFYSIFLIMTALSVISGCKESDPPTACFYSNDYVVDVYETISPSNCSENASSYLWLIDDEGLGQTSTAKNPNISWNTPGFYTVTLECTSSSGEKDKEYNTYTVFDFCYLCEFHDPNDTAWGPDGRYESEYICSYEYDTKEGMEALRSYYESQDYTCDKQ